MTKNRIHNGQHTLNFLAAHELIVDNFAGGGGASAGIEKAFGRPIDIAINHDPEAIALHKANHPHATHYCESVWDIDPRKATKGQPVGLAWFSPDCKHFSKAKGSTPVDKNIRGLAWVAIKWAATVRPRIIMLENVEEFKTWGPLNGNKPCREQKGKTFNEWKSQLIQLGYQVEHKELIAADFGAPTTRKRFFLIARCDGKPIIWPQKTHSKTGDSYLPKWRPAADCINWSIPCHSIFLTKEESKKTGVRRPLADNTMARIARGIDRFVLNDPKPFIVRIGQTGWGGNKMQYAINKPLTTITSKSEHCLVVPFITKYFGHNNGEARQGQNPAYPLSTVTAGGNRFGLVEVSCQPKQLKTLAYVTQFNRTNISLKPNKPFGTLRAGGTVYGLIEASCHATTSKQPQVHAFLMKYFGQGTGQSLNDPMHTITTKDRFGLVMIEGVEHQIVDIAMRMLTPREQYTAQGFDQSYKIDIDYNGKPLTKKAQQRMCGNSVSPVMSYHLVRANLEVNKSQSVA